MVVVYEFFKTHLQSRKKFEKKIHTHTHIHVVVKPTASSLYSESKMCLLVYTGF